MKTYSITTLGCRVNHYESEQLAALLRANGLSPAPADQADVRVVHTCSVTVQAASKSRQSVRRSTRLNVLATPMTTNGETDPAAAVQVASRIVQGETSSDTRSGRRPRVVVTGCWATSNPADAAALPGVDAVLTHHQNVGEELARLLDEWRTPPQRNLDAPPIEPHDQHTVKGKLEHDEFPREETHERGRQSGMMTLPQLDARQLNHQRAFLKIQDGCDAHCTYCIIPQLRPTLWSKPVGETVGEARRLVDAGHAEIVLTGIFIGAYGQATALRRRQGVETAEPLGRLIEAICTRVPGLRRLRLSSMEPGDLTPELLDVLRSHSQVVPHFHLPLQSGSDRLLRRMNRQYTRDDFLRMAEQVHAAFDRPAITTDIIVGFPGETDEQFAHTLDVANRVRFIHTHAFSYSPRPGTAAARWTDDFVRGPVVNERISTLTALADRHSYEFRQQFLNETVEVLVEHPHKVDPTTHAGFGAPSDDPDSSRPRRHGRSERYFPVRFRADLPPGAAARLRVTRVTPTHTFGDLA